MSRIAANQIESLSPLTQPINLVGSEIQINGTPVDDPATKGQPDGYASLDSLGTVPVSQLPVDIPNGISSLDVYGKIPLANLPSSIFIYKGIWNASTNTPALMDGVGDPGWVYRVVADGTQNLGSGSIAFNIGDYVIQNDLGVWEKADTTDNFAALLGDNVILNGTFEGSTISGWVIYADSAATSPVDGVGGSPNITFSAVASTKLRGTYVGSIVKDAANRQGQGVSYDFSIQEADQGGVLQVSFDYLVSSGNFSAGSFTTDSDITIWIYDVTNGILIPVSDRKLYSNSSTVAGRYLGSFQAAINSVSYRLILHVGSTSASAYTLAIDTVKISPVQVIPASIVTEWQPFPSVAAGTLITATTTNPTYGTVTQNVAMWRRVGDSMEILWTYRQSTSGTTGSGTYLFNLPPGYQIDTSKIVPSTSNVQPIGAWNYADSHTIFASGWVSPYSATQLFCGGPYTTSLGSAHIFNPWSSTNGPFSATSPLSISIRATVPIAGWGAVIQTAFTGDDGRVIAAAYWQTSNANSDTSTPIAFGGKDFDTHNAVSLSPFRFTAPISAIYRIGGTLNSTDQSRYVSLYKNGVSYKAVGYIGPTGTTQLSGQIFLAAGEYIDVRTHSLTTIVGNASQNNMGNSHITIERVSGNAVALGILPNPLTNTARVEKTTHTQSTAIIPFDNTIPQSGEGVEVFTVTHTPMLATSYVRVRAVLNFAQDTYSASVIIAALFRDSVANAVAADKCYNGANNVWDGQIILDYRVLAGSTAPVTWKVRMGSYQGAAFTINGRGNAGIFGGVNISSLTVTEEPI